MHQIPHQQIVDLTRKQRLRLISAVCLLLCLVLTGCAQQTELPDSVTSVRFKTLSGDELTVNSKAGPTLVNFWSTSCVICIKEMPHLSEFYKEFSPKGFELIAVAMPYDPPNEVVELAKGKDLPFPVAVDIQGEAVEAFGNVVATPTSFLVGSNGRIIERYVGAIDLPKLRSQLNQIMESS